MSLQYDLLQFTNVLIINPSSFFLYTSHPLWGLLFYVSPNVHYKFVWPFIFTSKSDAFINKSRNTLLQKGSLYTGVDATLIFKIAFLKNQVLFRRRVSHYTGVDNFPLVLLVLFHRRAVFFENQVLSRRRVSHYTGVDTFPLVLPVLFHRRAVFSEKSSTLS